MIFSEERSEVAKAYTEAWGKITTPKHNKDVEVVMKSGGKYKFAYTDLTGIFEAIKKLLAEHGIGIMQDTGTIVEESGKTLVFVQTMLLHSSGQYIQSEQMKLSANPSIQDFGGQISYLRRYQLSALMGISTESDDDANGGLGNQATFNEPKGSNAGAPAKEAPKTASDKQKTMIKSKLKVVSETLNTTPDELYSQIQQKFKTSVAIDKLNPYGASKIIEQLLALEKGELL